MALAFLVLLAIWAVQALAVPSGRTVEFPGGDAGRVVFSGSGHAGAGLICIDCHTGIFSIRKRTGGGGPAMGLQEHSSEKSCAACHNGVRSFASFDPASCARCHDPGSPEQR